jgi:small subunit ribosomal protein S13
MARISGVDLPQNKMAKISLRYLFGIGPKLAIDILAEVGISPEKKMKDFTEEEVARINALIDRKYVVEGGLRRQIMQNIQRLKNTRSYRGIRHIKGLPVRGQQTQSNARTRKGKKKTVAGKKSVKAMR